MSNPQDHPSSPPPPSTSNSSSSTPPSTSPKPSLKASQVKEIPAPKSDYSSESESFQYVTEGDGHGPSGFEKTQESPSEREGACGEDGGKGKGAVLAICGVAQDRLDESGVNSGGSGSGEAAEGLVHLSKQRDEPVSSTEETLADQLKKVGATYDLKKRKATTTKTPNVPNPSKKRKASSPTTTAF
uniref:Protein gar2-like n=1 Tax=Nicotiana tabacum TaxID=4097 RepID=A0A1S3Y0I2_TOBAC|nr:PREDICTED: protein gar2-like [Nicotiana tabacum]